MKFDGNGWVPVGVAGFSGGAATSTTLILDNAGTPIIGYADGSKDGKATVMKFNVSLPVVTASANCGPGPITLTAAGGSVGNYRWYTMLSGGAPIAGATEPTFITPTLPLTTTYYVSVIKGAFESDRVPVEATINEIPNPPTIKAAISYCQNATPSPLTATGSNLKWYTSATDGFSFISPPEPNTTTIGTTKYYVSQTINGCESSRAMISVTVIANPTPTFVPFANNTVCSSVTNFALTGGQPTGGIYGGTGVSNGVFNAAAAGPGSHTITYTITENGCMGTATQTIFVSTCTGVKEVSALTKALIIYPNPTRNNLTISLPLPNATDIQVRLSDMKGSIIIEKSYQKKSGNFVSSFDLSKEAKGVYNLQIITEKEVINKQIVVQ